MTPCASQLAENNLKANLSAMPTGFQCPAPSHSPHWLFARDGALSCKINGAWLGGCSVPRSAGRELLSTFKLDCPTGLFIEPSHPAQIRVALEKLAPRQALVAWIPDPSTFSLFLLGEDFSSDLLAGRLFFSVGDDLGRSLLQQPGLPVPQQFVKTRLLDPQRAEILIAAMTPVINAENARRNAEIQRLHDSIAPDPSGKWVVYAPLDFHPGDYASRRLAKIAPGQIAVNADRPDESSPLGLLQHLPGARGLLTLRLSRKDLPFVPHSFPIATWTLKPPLPAAINPADQLLVPTRDLQNQALKTGWKNILLASARADGNPPPGQQVLVFGDACWIPADQRDFLHSSHRLLYEAIGNELVERPFNLTPSIADFLNIRARKLDIRPQDLDARLFVDELIFPAFTQGLIQFLISRGITPINPTLGNWTEWDNALGQTRVIVNARPFDPVAALEYADRPLINPLGLAADELVRQIITPPPASAPEAPPLDLSLLR